MTTAGDASPQLDRDNPWPGLASFEESAHQFFRGRHAEAALLLRHVLNAPVTVLHGRSGLGKTSLLQAGLFPRLRQAHFLPVHVRFDLSTDVRPLARQLLDALRATLASERVEAAPPDAEDSLWAYLHRADVELWSPRNQLLTPVLVIDQFEELFTQGERARELARAFRDDLGDLAENRIPSGLAARLSAEPSLADGFQLRTRRYRIVISLREDFLPEFDGWRRLIPSLGLTRVRLLPMTTAQGFDAVYTPAAHLMTERVARRIVTIVAGREPNVVDAAAASPAGDREARGARDDRDEPDDLGAPSVEPALLSLFCRELNEDRKRRGEATIGEALLSGGQQDILANHYASCVETLTPRAAAFIETELISKRGYRDSFPREDAVPAYLSEEELSRLIQARIVRLEDRYGTPRVELTHDVLTGIVRQYRDRRANEQERAAVLARAEEERQAEERRRLQAEARWGRRLKWLSAALAVVSVAALVLAGFAHLQSRIAASAAARAQSAERDARSAAALAERRLGIMRQGLQVRQAVLTGDFASMARLMDAQHPDAALRFTATANRLGSGGAPQFRFQLRPATPLPTSGPDAVASVTYRLAHATFKNPLMTTGPERQFVATYEGWGCLNVVIALVEFQDPEKVPALAQFDMCKALGWT